MSIRSKLETALGLTRGDVTIALFVAFTALFGFLYVTFFDDRFPERERLELLRLQSRHDSILAVREGGTTMRPRQTIAADSLPSLQTVLAENAAAPEPKGSTASTRASTPAPSSIDLNSATREQLETLPGIGAKTAEAIIERRRHIPFRRAEDLMEVKGIGEKKLAKIRPFLRTARK
ncbi:MAG TPA: helix-hairpin-helix domain-containing protein [Candidatus Kapabacteria bacterium]|jgi:competence ComEA-like helix-hairpin-helix protein|nr:helix-hairpin-helix domain-containing protein [Candidatus Kapabacteria bacterium]